MFEVFEHTADLGLRVQAETFEQLLAEAGKALFSLIVANLDQVQPVLEKTIQLETEGDDFLLFDWMNELLFCFETEHLLLCDFRVVRHGSKIDARVRGEIMDPQRHQLEHEVKAITYHGLSVVEHSGYWEAEVIVDI